MTVRSSARKNTCSRGACSIEKKSARLIGMPSSTFLSEPTDGLDLFCSIRETDALLTPARFANSRWDSPCISRIARSRVPTSNSIEGFTRGQLLNLLNILNRQVASAQATLLSYFEAGKRLSIFLSVA